jgi:polyhydroxyalkanoate synthesis regulator phasin
MAHLSPEASGLFVSSFLTQLFFKLVEKGVLSDEDAREVLDQTLLAAEHAQGLYQPRDPVKEVRVLLEEMLRAVPRTPSKGEAPPRKGRGPGRSGNKS